MPDSQTMTVQLGGQERTLRLSVAAVRYAETQHDVTFQLQELMQDPVAVVPRLLQICLLLEDGDVSEAQALRWLAQSDRQEEIEDFLLTQLERVVDVMGKSSRALQDAVPDPPEAHVSVVREALEKVMREQMGSSSGGRSTA